MTPIAFAAGRPGASGTTTNMQAVAVNDERFSIEFSARRADMFLVQGEV